MHCAIPNCINNRSEFKAYCSQCCEIKDSNFVYAEQQGLFCLDGYFGPPWPQGFYIRKRKKILSNQNDTTSTSTSANLNELDKHYGAQRKTAIFSPFSPELRLPESTLMCKSKLPNSTLLSNDSDCDIDEMALQSKFYNDNGNDNNDDNNYIYDYNDNNHDNDEDNEYGNNGENNGEDNGYDTNDNNSNKDEMNDNINNNDGIDKNNNCIADDVYLNDYENDENSNKLHINLNPQQYLSDNANVAEDLTKDDSYHSNSRDASFCELVEVKQRPKLSINNNDNTNNMKVDNIVIDSDDDDNEDEGDDVEIVDVTDDVKQIKYRNKLNSNRNKQHNELINLIGNNDSKKKVNNGSSHSNSHNKRHTVINFNSLSSTASSSSTTSNKNINNSLTLPLKLIRSSQVNINNINNNNNINSISSGNVAKSLPDTIKSSNDNKMKRFDKNENNNCSSSSTNVLNAKSRVKPNIITLQQSLVKAAATNNSRSSTKGANIVKNKQSKMDDWMVG